MEAKFSQLATCVNLLARFHVVVEHGDQIIDPEKQKHKQFFKFKDIWLTLYLKYIPFNR